MAAAAAATCAVFDRSLPDTRSATQNGGAGWIGSKAGARNAFITIDSNGYVDQAAAAGAAVSGTVDVGLLVDDVASTVAADSTDAKAVRYRIFTDETEIELPLVNNSDTFVTVLATRVGESLGIYRRSTGDYAADANASSHLYVTGVNVAKGTVRCKVIEANRLK